MNTQKEFPTNNNEKIIKLTEGGNLRVWCITQKPTKREAYIDGRQ